MSHIVQMHARSQAGKILTFLIEREGEWYLPHEFMGSRRDVPFIGYKASTRLCELQKQGLVKSRWSKTAKEMKMNMKEYSISEEALLRIQKFGDEMTVKMRGSKKKTRKPKDEMASSGNIAKVSERGIQQKSFFSRVFSKISL